MKTFSMLIALNPSRNWDEFCTEASLKCSQHWRVKWDESSQISALDARRIFAHHQTFRIFERKKLRWEKKKSVDIFHIYSRRKIIQKNVSITKIKAGRINGLLTHLMQIYWEDYLNGKLSSLRKGWVFVDPTIWKLNTFSITCCCLA